MLKEQEPILSQIEEEERVSRSERSVKNNKGKYEQDTMIWEGVKDLEDLDHDLEDVPVEGRGNKWGWGNEEMSKGRRKMGGGNKDKDK